MARQHRHYSSSEVAFLEHLSLRIREAREAAGLSQETLADRAGLSRSHISKIESPPHDLQITTLRALALGLHLSLADLLPDA